MPPASAPSPAPALTPSSAMPHAAIGLHQALIYVMVTMSAADSVMTDRELHKIGNIVANLPVFRDFDPKQLVAIAEECGAVLAGAGGGDGGLDAILQAVVSALPESMHETAYALAVEVAAADLVVHQEELRLLQILRNALGVERLTAAAIERGARARHTIP